MKFLDLFAGIGGFRLGMESAGHECLGFCEIDKFARASYKAIHDTEGEIELHDITRVTDESIRGFGSVALSVEDFRAKLSQLRDTDEVLKIHEELCSLKSAGLHLFSDLNIYSLKTSEDSSIMTRGLHLKPSSEPWTDWGMMWSGKCLTAKISESLKIGSECSLSGILEDNVPETFFLSSEKMQNLIINSQKSK